MSVLGYAFCKQAWCLVAPSEVRGLRCELDALPVKFILGSPQNHPFEFVVRKPRALQEAGVLDFFTGMTHLSLLSFTL